MIGSFERASLAMVAIAALTLVGCASQAPATAPKAAAAQIAPASAAKAAAPTAATTASEYYVVLPEDGRFYAFGDFKTYQQYLEHGEVALTRARIGAGPNGQTVVFGITNDDVKNNRPNPAELVFDGKLTGADDFYGEVLKDGRYYVFGDLKDMKPFVAFGEVPYAYTDIAAGPKGETLVWVMNSASFKKGRPETRIARFKAARAAK